MKATDIVMERLSEMQNFYNHKLQKNKFTWKKEPTHLSFFFSPVKKESLFNRAERIKEMALIDEQIDAFLEKNK